MKKIIALSITLTMLILISCEYMAPTVPGPECMDSKKIKTDTIGGRYREVDCMEWYLDRENPILCIRVEDWTLGRHIDNVPGALVKLYNNKADQLGRINAIDSGYTNKSGLVIFREMPAIGIWYSCDWDTLSTLTSEDYNFEGLWDDQHRAQWKRILVGSVANINIQNFTPDSLHITASSVYDPNGTAPVKVDGLGSYTLRRKANTTHTISIERFIRTDSIKNYTYIVNKGPGQSTFIEVR